MAIDELPPELDELRVRLRTFLRNELLPREQADGVQDESQTSAELRRWVRSRSNELGFFRLTQPREIGGAGLGPLGQTALREEVAASGCVLGRLLFGGNGGMLRQGSPEQKQRYLEPALRGELSAAFAFTDARQGPRTTAVRRDGNFVVNGVKSFVSGGPHADVLLTVANVTENADGPTGSAVFIIRREAPGVVLRRELRTLDGGIHGEFAFENVTVAPEDVLGEIGKGLPRALENINGLRLAVAASACGTGRWALDYTLDQIDQPHRSGVPLAEREQVQAMLADSATDLYAARAALYATARAAEGGENVEVETAMAKSLATEAVTRIVDRAIQLTGAAAVVEDHPLARLYRQIRGWRIAEGTTEILKLSVARGLLARRRQ
ncbi:MAG TPA: acyl-CoA dehydrogenase family protein [Dehalococcoidia bacterium]|jgi:acyl-CoA dehydrogenase|nr:acyl-CoA dehydrogenase family protein [Dehalococcoidia bacterium]